MKTLKLIIAGVATALLINSCSNDRDEAEKMETIEKVKNSNQKIKLNKSGTESRDGDAGVLSDTITIKSGNAVLSEDPDSNLDPDGSEIVPPGDVKPPKGGK